MTLLIAITFLINNVQTLSEEETEVFIEQKPREDLHIEFNSSNINVLSKENFTTFTEQHSPLLVLFYVPWCPYCKALSPEYTKTSDVLANQNSTVKVSIVNCESENEICNNNSISGFPTIMLFIDSKVAQFEGTFNSENIIEFVEKEMFGSYETVQTVTEIEMKLTTNKLIVISTMDKTEYKDEMALFKEFSNRYNKLLFINCPSDECIRKYDSNILMLKTFDAPIVKLINPITHETLLKFIEDNCIEIGGHFNSLAVDIVFKVNKTTVFFFRNESDNKHIETDKAFKTIGKEYYERMHFFTVDVNLNDELQQRIGDFFSITPSQQPRMLIYKVKIDQSIFYGMELYIMKNVETLDDINETNIKQFIEDYYEGKLEREINSEIPPDEQMEEFTIVVGKTFKELVIDNKKHVMILFIEQECFVGCEDAHMIWKSLGEKYNKESNEVEFAMIDMTFNEVRGFEVKSYPTIMLFKKEYKDQPEVYNGKLTLTDIEEWMAKQVGWVKNKESKSEDL